MAMRAKYGSSVVTIGVGRLQKREAPEPDEFKSTSYITYSLRKHTVPEYPMISTNAEKAKRYTHEKGNRTDRQYNSDPR